MKYLSYAVIALLLGTAGYAAVEHGRAVASAQQVALLGDAVNRQAASIRLLQGSVDSSNRITVGMNTRLDGIANQHTIVTERVITLEKTDAHIHDFLSLALPPNGCVLDDTCGAPATIRPAVSEPYATVQPPTPGQVRGSSGRSE